MEHTFSWSFQTCCVLAKWECAFRNKATIYSSTRKWAAPENTLNSPGSQTNRTPILIRQSKITRFAQTIVFHWLSIPSSFLVQNMNKTIMGITNPFYLHSKSRKNLLLFLYQQERVSRYKFGCIIIFIIQPKLSFETNYQSNSWIHTTQAILDQLSAFLFVNIENIYIVIM